MLEWLAAVALSIGGVGIWQMHFIAMLGLDTSGMPVRYGTAGPRCRLAEACHLA